MLGNGIGARQTSGSYSNIDATGEPELAAALEGSWFDSAGWRAMPSVDQSVWFKMQGDGGTYQIVTPTVLVQPFTAMTPKWHCTKVLATTLN